MAKNPKSKNEPIISKKHLARAERERRQTRIILWTSAVVLLAIVLLIGYGVLEKYVLEPREPVAVVNGEKIQTKEFQDLARYQRRILVNNAIQTYGIIQQFGNDPNFAAQFAQQLAQVQYQLAPAILGSDVRDQMIQSELVRQEAERRNITVSDEELDAEMERLFGFYENGTPTPTNTLPPPAPTSTLSPLQLTLIPPTATPTLTPTAVVTETETITGTQTVTATAVASPTATVAATATPEATPTATGPITPTATATTAPTATPYTREGYEELYQTQMEQFEADNISEDTIRALVRDSLLRDKVMESVLDELGVNRIQEQVWARHILVDSQEVAQDIKSQLDNGADFCALALAYSTDESNKNNCGDLDWFSSYDMVDPFSEAAFAMEMGEISQPVESEFGFHIIQVLGHEERELSASEYESARERAFASWLNDLREASEIELMETEALATRVPETPVIPDEILAFIQQSGSLPTNLLEETP